MIIPRALAVIALCATAAAAFGACSSSGTVRAQAGSTITPASREPASDARPADAKPLRVLVGFASYYSDALAGHKTSNGERYDPKQFTAANRDLPFGSVVRVIRADTGAKVIVRINDRGPFGDRRRILDLSRAAARELNMIGRGVARVRAEILELGPRRGSHPTKRPKPRARNR